jgi:hypothetical protein
MTMALKQLLQMVSPLLAKEAQLMHKNTSFSKLHMMDRSLARVNSLLMMMMTTMMMMMMMMMIMTRKIQTVDPILPHLLQSRCLS